jgi:hypothetical protein
VKRYFKSYPAQRKAVVKRSASEKERRKQKDVAERATPYLLLNVFDRKRQA